MAFLDWFTYSDNNIDGQSRKKAYTLWESDIIAGKDVGTVKALSRFMPYRLCVTPELVSLLLAMGDKVEVLDPEELRNEVMDSLKKSFERY